MAQVFLGLGANLDDPKHQLLAAIDALKLLPETKLIAVSDFFISSPMGPQDQPDYVNAVAWIETALTPHALLDACQAIEQSQRRVKQRHWGERTIDLDLLAYDDLVLSDERLTIPHVGITQRDFVILPWQQIAPDYNIPLIGRVADITPTATYSATVISPFEKT